MGCDPTIGDPARVATRAGSFLSEQPDYSEVASYKDGWSEAIPIIPTQPPTRARLARAAPAAPPRRTRGGAVPIRWCAMKDAAERSSAAVGRGSRAHDPSLPHAPTRTPT